MLSPVLSSSFDGDDGDVNDEKIRLFSSPLATVLYDMSKREFVINKAGDG